MADISLCLIIVDGKILMCKREKKNGDKFSEMYGLPGGHVKKDEDNKTGCCREVREETNLHISNPKFIKTYKFDNNDIHLFTKEIKDIDGIKLNHEHTDYKLFSPDELTKRSIIPTTKDMYKDYKDKLLNEQVDRIKSLITVINEDLNDYYHAKANPEKDEYELEVDEIGVLGYMDNRASEGAKYLQYRASKGELIPTIRLNIGYPNELFKTSPLYGKNYDYIFLIYNNDKEKKVILTLGLVPKYNGFQIIHIHGEDEIRGKEIGIRIYEELSKTFKKPIYSGGSQTPNSRYGIWNKLLQKYPNNVVAYNTKTRKNLRIENGDTNFLYAGNENSYDFILNFLPLK